MPSAAHMFFLGSSSRNAQCSTFSMSISIFGTVVSLLTSIAVRAARYAGLGVICLGC